MVLPTEYGRVIFLLICGALIAEGVVAKECTNVPTQLGERAHGMMDLLSHVAEASGDCASSFPGHRCYSDSLIQRHSLSNRRMLTGQAKLGNDKHSGTSSEQFLQEFPLQKVRLSPMSPLAVAQKTNLQYLLMLEPDRLVWSFRNTAGLNTSGMTYGGWEKPSSELRGHFVGHYLSASSLLWASTGNEALRNNMERVISDLAECQEKMGNGYLSAFPEEFFDRFELLQPVWAPYYTIHKIMAGLLDQYTLAGSNQCLYMVTRMADYFQRRVDRTIAQYTIEQHWQSLNEEVGGMNDVLYRLYAITGNQDHLRLAHLFDKPCFLGPLALQTDNLADFHANTHIPLIVGSQMRYEVVGDPIYKTIAEYFMHTVNSSHRYATGGTSSGEFWQEPMRLGSTLDQEDQETCTTYNMLKVSRNLFRWKADAAHMDYYERTLINGILSVQRGTDPGVMIYMLPLGTGNSKARGYHGWGTPFDSFWCCYGSGIESFSKLGDSIYFHRPAPSPVLYVGQFVSSSVHWADAGLLVNQEAGLPSSAEPLLQVVLRIDNLPQTDGGAASALNSEATVAIRIPVWASKDSSAVVASLNGQPLPKPSPGSFLEVKQKWKGGDVLQVSLPMGLHTERIQDDRSSYQTLHSILFGPYLLAGMTNSSQLAPGLDPRNPESWVTPISSQANDMLVTLGMPVWTRADTADSFVIKHSGGRNAVLGAGRRPKKGTDEAMYSTFRIVPTELLARRWARQMAARDAVGMEGPRGSSNMWQVPVLRNSLGEKEKDGAASTGQSRGKLSTRSLCSALANARTAIALEMFDRPGTFVSSSNPGGALSFATLVEEHQKQGRESLRHTPATLALAEYKLIQELSSNISALSTASLSQALFIVVPGLAGKGTISLQAASRRGMYLSRTGLRGTGSQLEEIVGNILSPPAGAPEKAAFDQQSSFHCSKPLARYNRISFVAEGAIGNFVLQPIAAIQDETYTSYFNMK